MKIKTITNYLLQTQLKMSLIYYCGVDQLVCNHHYYYVKSLLCCSTATDYALLNNHKECVQILRDRGGMTISEIKEIAALHIQTAYRGHRYVEADTL